MQNSHLIIGSVFMFLCIVSAIFAGCTSSTTSTSAPMQTLSPISTISTTVTQDNSLTLVESHAETGDYGTVYVAGTIKSNVDKTYTYVQVTINEYDASGAVVRSTMANMNNLEPYGTWKFKAPVLDKDATRFKVETITGY